MAQSSTHSSATRQQGQTLCRRGPQYWDDFSLDSTSNTVPEKCHRTLSCLRPQAGLLIIKLSFPFLSFPTSDPVSKPAGQFYSAIRWHLIRDVRRTVMQELRSDRRPPRRRRRGGKKKRRMYWRLEQLRRLKQSVSDQVCASVVPTLVATWRVAAAISSAQIQVVCANHQRQRILSSLRAWRRCAQIVRYAAVYRCNMARSGGTIKPFSVLTDHLPSSSPQLCMYPDPHARPFVPVRPAAGEGDGSSATELWAVKKKTSWNLTRGSAN